MEPIYIVDAFADEPFTGNPAAVVLLTEPKSQEWMQAVATEMNLSETAFVDRYSGSEVPQLRWFGSKCETDLCGHATLATAHVLGGSRRFATRSGELACRELDDGYIEMNFPADPVTPVDQEWQSVFPGTDVVSTWKAKASTKHLVELATAQEVRDVRPNFAAFETLGLDGVIVTALGDSEGTDFVSRYFHPAFGVPEDSATGSARCTLASWWAPRLGRLELHAMQLSARTARLRVRLDGDRVYLAGRAVTVMTGMLAV